MSGDDAERLEAARLVVLRVLSGEADPETVPALFEEDAVLFAVRRVEAEDPGWLLERLADPALPLEGRRRVAAETRDLRERARALVAEEQVRE